MMVRRIMRREAVSWCLDVHYARRIPSITFAFGLYSPLLTGVVTFGTPSSAPLRVGVCGPEFSTFVLELNRLAIIDGPKNAASFLVGGAMRRLPNSVIVSYADCGAGHVGYVYQACNFIYTGLSAKRTDWKVAGLEHLHGQTIADKSRGQTNRAEWMRDTFGDAFYLNERDRKHRYIYFTGDKSFKRSARAALKYEALPYPKGHTQRHKPLRSPATQGVLFCGEVVKV